MYLPLVLILATFVRFYQLDNLSLNLDESQSVWQATHSIQYIIEYMSKNVHLPLHNSLLHYWIIFFGTSEVSVRMLSAIPGLIAVIALYYLASEVLNKNGARLAVLIGAVSPFWIWYSREIRMYSVLVTLTTLSYLFYVKAYKTGKFKYFLIHSLINILGIYTHYFFILILLVQFIFFLVGSLKKYPSLVTKKRLFSYFTLDASIVTLSFLPWVYKLTTSTGIAKFGPELVKPQPFNIALSFYEFIYGYQSSEITMLGIAMWPLIILFLFLFLSKRHRPSSFIPLLFLGSLLPVLLTYFLSVTIKPVYLTRYTSTASPLFIILLSWFLIEFKPKFYRNFVILFFISTLVVSSISQYVNNNNDYHEDYRGAKEYLYKKVTINDIVAVAPAYTIYPMQYYYNGKAKMVTLPLWDKKKGAIPILNEQNLEKDIKTISIGHKILYLVVTTNLSDSNEVKEFLDGRFKKIEKIQISKNIQVNAYDIKYLSSGIIKN